MFQIFNFCQTKIFEVYWVALAHLFVPETFGPLELSVVLEAIWYILVVDASELGQFQFQFCIFCNPRDLLMGFPGLFAGQISTWTCLCRFCSVMFRAPWKNRPRSLKKRWAKNSRTVGTLTTSPTLIGFQVPSDETKTHQGAEMAAGFGVWSPQKVLV